MEAETVSDDQDESQPIPAGMRYLHGKVVPHLTVEERVARGKAARREVPRSSHAGFTPGGYRLDPVAWLERQAVSRVPELVPIRYGRMPVSPFTFYRGAALLMAADLAGTPRSGLTTQVCGDAHLMNFGVFASPERRLEFGINDFDETCRGRGSGTSSASRPASPSPGATGGSRPSSAPGCCSPCSASTGRACTGSRR